MYCATSQGACVTVAALLQYFLMAAFCWMFVEGIYLYLLVVKVYNIENKMHIYHVMSWGKFLSTFLLQCLFWYTLAICSLFLCLYCRFSRCHCRPVAEYCCRKRWNPQFRGRWIVSTSLKFPFPFSFRILLSECVILCNNKKKVWLLSIIF